MFLRKKSLICILLFPCFFIIIQFSPVSAELIRFDFTPGKELSAYNGTISLEEVTVNNGPSVTFPDSSTDSTGFTHDNIARFSGGHLANPNLNLKSKGFSFLKADLDLKGDFTVSFWVKVDRLDQPELSAVMTFGDDLSLRPAVKSGRFFQIDIGMNRSSETVFRVRSNKKSDITEIPKKKWMHLTIVRKKLSIQSYLNGQLIKTFNYTTHHFTELKIGANRKGERGLACDLNDIRIFNYALNEIEIKNVYTSSLNQTKNRKVSLGNQTSEITQSLENNRVRSPGQNSVQWVDNFSKAKQQAMQGNQIILIYFYSDKIPKCKEIEDVIFSSKEFLSLSQKIVCFKETYTDKAILYKKYDVFLFPTIILLNPAGSIKEIFEFDIYKSELIQSLQ